MSLTTTTTTTRPLSPAARLASTASFFASLASNSPPRTLLTHFSTIHVPSIQHAPANCPNPSLSLLSGAHAIRSYFDLLATHWERSATTIHSKAPKGDFGVEVHAEIRWMWKQSRREWTEECTCLLEFDEVGKIVKLSVRTESGPETCVMSAVDGPNCSLVDFCANEAKKSKSRALVEGLPSDIASSSSMALRSSYPSSALPSYMKPSPNPAQYPSSSYSSQYSTPSSQYSTSQYPTSQYSTPPSLPYSSSSSSTASSLPAYMKSGSTPTASATSLASYYSSHPYTGHGGHPNYPNMRQISASEE